jgi:tRNA (cmo5U34)-methyltransferase
MVAIARDRCQRYARVSFEVARLEQLELPSADLVVSYYTLQFVRVRERLFEKILLPPARAQTLATGIYHDWKRKQGFSDAEVAAKERSLRGVLEPQTSAENRALLRKAGFTEATPVFRWLSWEGLLVRAAGA